MEKAAPFLAALERVPKRVVEFLREVMSREPEHPEARTVQKNEKSVQNVRLESQRKRPDQFGQIVSGASASS